MTTLNIIERQCSVCKEFRNPETDFYSHSGNLCKACFKERHYTRRNARKAMEEAAPAVRSYERKVKVVISVKKPMEDYLL